MSGPPAEEPVVAFCRARENMLRMKRTTAVERSEVNDAYRTLSQMLVQSMERDGIQHLRYVRPDGAAVYIKLSRGRRAAVTFKTPDDVLALLDDVASNLTDVASEALPKAVARLVHARAKERGTVSGPRISIVPTVGVRARIVEHAEAPREVHHLATQVDESHRGREDLRVRMKPVQSEYRHAETALLEQIAKEGSSAPPEAVVRMADTDANGVVRGEQNLRVQTVRRPRKKRNVFALKNVLAIVQEAVAHVAQLRDGTFDARLRDATAQRLTEALAEKEARGDDAVERVLVRRQRLRGTPQRPPRPPGAPALPRGHSEPTR